MTRILIADDHALVRQGAKDVLADAIPDAQFGEASTTQETQARLHSEHWDVLVLDVFMPGRTGLEVLQEIRQSAPELPVLVMSSAPVEQMAVRVFELGAAGYLNKQSAPEELANAVKQVLLGRKFVSGRAAGELAAQISRSARASHARLSDREFEVMRLVLAGSSLKEVAAEMCLSPKTISTFHTRIWEKLGVHNDVELFRYALENKLVGLPLPADQAPSPRSEPPVT